VSGNGQDFGHSKGLRAILAFSRILGEREVLALPTRTDRARAFLRRCPRRPDLSRVTTTRKVAYSNMHTTGAGIVDVVPQEGRVETAEAARLFVILAPMEIR
jgi:hypothetical protein